VKGYTAWTWTVTSSIYERVIFKHEYGKFKMCV